MVEDQILRFTKECHKCNEYINEFHGNLAMLSEVITQVEMANKTIGIRIRKCTIMLGVNIKYQSSFVGKNCGAVNCFCYLFFWVSVTRFRKLISAKSRFEKKKCGKINLKTLIFCNEKYA